MGHSIRSKPIAFNVSVDESDWDIEMGGWRVSALRLPGVRVDAIYVEGKRTDPDRFGVDTPQEILRWMPSPRPSKARIAVTITEELLTQKESEHQIASWRTRAERWKYLTALFTTVVAVVGPVMTLIVYPLLNNNDQKIGSDLQVTQVAEKMQQVNTKGLQTQTSKDLNSSQIVGQSEQEVEKEQQKKESQSGNDEEDQSSTLINDDKESTSINRPEEKQKRTPKENRRSKRPSHPSKSERKAINIVAAKASECFAHRGGKGAITVSFDKNGISHINSFNQGTLSGTESKCILQLFNSIKIEKKSVTGIPIRRSILLSEKHGTGV